MQAGVFGGICLLAFLLSEGRGEELDLRKEVLQDEDKVKDNVGLRKSSDLETPSDLKSDLSLDVTQTNSGSNEGRSGDVSQSDSRRDSKDGSTYAETFADSGKSRATNAAGGAPASSFNPFNEELGPYRPSTFSQAEAQAINNDAYGQGISAYPYPASYPYSAGLNSPQERAENRLHQPSLNVNPQSGGGNYQRDPAYGPHGQGLSSTQPQNLADNRLYQPGYSSIPSVSPYNQGSSFPQVPGQGDSESNIPIIEPKFLLPKTAPTSDSISAFPSSYSYAPLSGASSLYTQDNSGPYQPIPLPNPDFSPYDRFLVPYKGPSSTRTHGDIEEYHPAPLMRSKEDRFETIPYSQGPNLLNSYSQKEPYQAIPLLDSKPSPYDSYLGPYRDPYPAIHIDDEEYQPIPIPKPSNKQQEDLSRLYSERSYSSYSNSRYQNSDNTQSLISRTSNSPYMVPYSESIHSQNQINSGAYQPMPIPSNSIRKNPTQDELDPYQSIPVPESEPSRYESSMVESSERDSQKLQDDRIANVYESDRYANDPKTDATLPSTYNVAARSHEPNPTVDDADSNADLISKGGWNPYEFNPYTPSGAYPRLYPSGAEAAGIHPDNKAAASTVAHANSQGISPFATDYPSESPIRPGVYYPLEGPPKIFPSGQSSPIAFEDAKSRIILPYEYVFPNKMPGGENVIKCSKENEFHHFWSKELECLVCICLNEYGILQPVCASCGGCQSPPPKLPEAVPQLPESITVQPATPGPFEPIPIMPEPVPPPPPPPAQPEPNPPQPIQRPDQPVPTPEPYPVYPTVETPTSPVPVIFPEPVATLPPPSETAHCNPLPTGVPFTNPLHPCQLCICRETLVSGKTDVQIECKENPQCIAPADVTALPPIPDIPMPIPLPICEKFPENVLFPHPTESCKLCKCSKSSAEDGESEQQITCYPHPDCVPKTEPVTEPEIPPLPIPIEPDQPSKVPVPPPTVPLRKPDKPMEPVPLPEIVTVEPLPWPPITTTTPGPPLPVTPKPGPLPGPSPHESCRPYPPNQTFQHPWDECQLCMCSEATAVGMITVEVNCYTKPSCCIEPPDSVKTALPGFNVPSSNTSASQPTTSTNRPSAYPAYNPKSVNIYPGSNQGADPLNQPPVPPYSGFVDPSSSYPYQPNYPPQYVNPQYPEYPPRLPVLPGSGNSIGQYKPNSFGYPPNYQYAPGDTVGGNYPPQGYQPFDPRFQSVPAPSYPGMYQRAYERPAMYAPAHSHSYVKPPIPAIGGPALQNLGTSYAAPTGYLKSGKDEEASR